MTFSTCFYESIVTGTEVSSSIGDEKNVVYHVNFSIETYYAKA